MAPEDVSTGPKLSAADEKLVQDLTGIYALVGTSVIMFNMQDGMLILAKAEECARSLVKVAKHHKQMMKVLKNMTKASDYGALIAVHGGLVMAMLANHNMLPTVPGILGRTQPKEEQHGEQRAEGANGVNYPNTEDLRNIALNLGYSGV